MKLLSKPTTTKTTRTTKCFPGMPQLALEFTSTQLFIHSRTISTLGFLDLFLQCTMWRWFFFCRHELHHDLKVWNKPKASFDGKSHQTHHIELVMQLMNPPATKIAPPICKSRKAPDMNIEYQKQNRMSELTSNDEKSQRVFFRLGQCFEALCSIVYW